MIAVRVAKWSLFYFICVYSADQQSLFIGTITPKIFEPILTELFRNIFPVIGISHHQNHDPLGWSVQVRQRGILES